MNGFPRHKSLMKSTTARRWQKPFRMTSYDAGDGGEARASSTIYHGRGYADVGVLPPPAADALANEGRKWRATPMSWRAVPGE